jgi:hypothetical protein
MANPIDNAGARTASMPPRLLAGRCRPQGEKKAVGGQRKPLKRLVSAKRIQGNPSPFPLNSFSAFGWIWLDLAKFGLWLGRNRKLSHKTVTSSN